MANFPSPFRDMVSVPSQMTASNFGSSSNSTNANAFSGSQGPFGFVGGGSSGAGIGSPQSRPTTLGGPFGSVNFGPGGRSLTPNPSMGGPPPPGLFHQPTTPHPSVLSASGQQQAPQQHSPGGTALPSLVNGPPPASSRNLFPALLNGMGGPGGSGSSAPFGAFGGSSNTMTNVFSHTGPGGTGASFGNSPARALSSLGLPQSSVQQKQSNIFGLLSIASGKDGVVRGSSYENDFLHSSPFSSAPGGPGMGFKGDSGGGDGGQQQHTAAAAALALLNRYNTKGFSDFNPSNYQHHNSSSTPLGFNENEFPSLSSQNRGSAGFGGMGSAFGGWKGSTIGSGRAGYANLMKPPSEAQPEFQIQNEDFPALPGAQEALSKKESSPSAAAGGDSSKDARFSSSEAKSQQPTSKRGIQTHQDGSVTGIPAGMLNDQFGMVGLLTFLRAIETDPSIVSLALGHDLTQLGLNLNAPEKNLYQTFGGPWSDVPCRPQDIDCSVPNEYMTNAAIVDKLAPIKLNRYGEDLLFYLFYNFGGEVFQLAAAAELYNRDWRYHKDERVWLARAPGMVPMEKSSTYERGTYYIFDPSHWRKIAKEMHLEYDRLEDRPMLPPQPQLQQTSLQSQPTPQQSSQSSSMIVPGGGGPQNN